ncbi:hypothetical protein TVAG_170050 [Trichomonas vaginalis G3]|uniref:UBX domain containing protein n=1 Tax=Trichomonas vaginalis (strain ATCC PRA-98 / G3) TaxID=412133 RepID=A2DPE9_TRIV3|nr:hypothetical protein TVAGG3_0680890 [Trichomonas vaginalis G3]EAY17693.1 hypothetical protein TVAG_170050 [Trichomonas vaginalis G3]KAI5507903.1 hypothetical protein TVAGG3_0680890 [Trichomonas vaginalis G3]|eukprot:XP_001329828.1 hypothetical protein [Trichomonas vaginalis G3]
MQSNKAILNNQDYLYELALSKQLEIQAQEEREVENQKQREVQIRINKQTMHERIQKSIEVGINGDMKIKFVLPNGRKIMKRYTNQMTVESLFQSIICDECYFDSNYEELPFFLRDVHGKIFERSNLTLEHAGIKSNTNFYVTLS